MTILFVDDHHALRTVFAEVLRTAGHTVLEAGSLFEAEHLMERYGGTIGVLVTEAILTTANGHDVAKRLKPLAPEAKVLYLSDQRPEELRKEGLLPARAQFLPKPFAAEDLAAKLHAIAPRTRKAAPARAARKRVKRRAAG
jgi:two-component system, cell cycle sensor histidine kinase and response regulator CckA